MNKSKDRCALCATVFCIFCSPFEYERMEREAMRMEMERLLQKRSVREGYVVLLRAEADLLLPKEAGIMRDFYLKTAQACLNWAEEVWGEWIRRDYNALEAVARAGFRTRSYRFAMRVPWQDEAHICIVCESERVVFGEEKDAYRMSHVWNFREGTLLPLTQILQLFRHELAKNDLPFSPHGAYRESDWIVFFRNKTSKNDFLEAKLPVKEK